MISRRRHIVVFEHESIRVGQVYDEVEFSEDSFNALQLYHASTKGMYYELGFKRIVFKEYVGVLQIGNLVIEVLPKADKRGADDNTQVVWRSILISMLQTVGMFNVKAPSSSSLRIKSNSILDLYFELFVSEIEYLLRNGLVKKYRKTEGNCTALKGNLLFNKHIQNNLVHQERSYVRYTTYDTAHLLHFILYKALRMLNQMNTVATLQSRIGALLLHFPEMPDIKVSDATFDKLVISRKTIQYENAIGMARLLLLNYHPDISKGNNNVLALMFDMNLLWEQFVTISLRRGFKESNRNAVVSGQLSKSFWKPKNGNKTSIRPDIVIKDESFGCVVLDTKWKNLSGTNPSANDLRQMYVYHEYFKAAKVALVYPGQNENREGVYWTPDGQIGNQNCSMIGLRPEGDIKAWQKGIFESVFDWIKLRSEE